MERVALKVIFKISALFGLCEQPPEVPYDLSIDTDWTWNIGTKAPSSFIPTVVLSTFSNSSAKK